MALDLSKPLRHKDSHEPAFIVALPSGQYVTIIDGRDDTGTRVYHATDREEAERMLENAPETRALDAVLHFDATGRIVRVLNCLTGQEIDIAGTSVAAKRIQTTYEVGEGLS